MLIKEKSERNTLEMVSVEILVPKEHLLQKIDRTVDFTNFYEFFEYLLNDPASHFSTIIYNFRHRFTQDTIEKVFTWIHFEAHKSGYLSPKVVFMDGTHIKANANINKKMKKAIPSAPRIYEEQLMKEINEDRQTYRKNLLTEAGLPNSRSIHICIVLPLANPAKNYLFSLIISYLSIIKTFLLFHETSSS